MTRGNGITAENAEDTEEWLGEILKGGYAEGAENAERGIRQEM